MTAPAPILLSGMFDMDNYGDLLFPLVAAHRLGAYGYRVVPVAPSARLAAFPDAMPPTDIARLLSDDEPIAGILVGGGYIIHTSSLEFLQQYRNGIEAWCGAGLWLGATLAGALRDVPVAWNAPGVPHPFSARQHGLINAALRAASYLSVRDRGSARLLAAPPDASLSIVPDPIAELARVWPKPGLSGAYRALLQRKGVPSDARLMAIHVRNRSMIGTSAAALGTMLGAFARSHDLTPILIAVGASHDDPAVARWLAPHLGRSAILLDDPVSLREVTAAFAHSAIYFGASLHGYIASAAYDVPGILVARPAYHKFSGFLEHAGRMQDLARDWTEALRLAAQRQREPPCSRIPPEVFAALDRHWEAVNAAMQAPQEHGDARRAFALELLRYGIRTAGPGWAMQPALNRLMRSAAASTGDASGNGLEGMEHEQPPAN
jgi:hypothetical protein